MQRGVSRPVLVVPGLYGSGPDHWQTHWEKQYGYVRVVQDDWDRPSCREWLPRLSAAVAAAPEPVALVAHSLGCALVAHLAAGPLRARVAGALLVAPADVDDPRHTPEVVRCFSPLPLVALGFPAIVVASRDDSFITFQRAEELAEAWGAALVDAGTLGHINADSQLGLWSDGHRLLERLC